MPSRRPCNFIHCTGICVIEECFHCVLVNCAMLAAFFIQRLVEDGVPNEWGVFSQQIPGRTGSQCRTFFRNLILRVSVYVIRHVFLLRAHFNAFVRMCWSE